MNPFTADVSNFALGVIWLFMLGIVMIAIAIVIEHRGRHER